MSKLIVAVVAAVAVAVGLSLASATAQTPPTEQAPRPTLSVGKTSTRWVSLHGSAYGVQRVWLQRRAHGRWTRVKKVRVRHHRFHTRVGQRRATVRYRVKAGHRRSRVIRAHLRAAPKPTSPTPAAVAGPMPTQTSDLPPTLAGGAAPYALAAPTTPTPTGTTQTDGTTTPTRSPATTPTGTTQADGTPTPSESPATTPTESPTGSPMGSPTGASTAPSSEATTASPTPTATPTATQPSDACGVRPRKTDNTYWSCTFHDEFNGTSLNRSKWLPQIYTSSGTAAAFACYQDSPRNVSVSGGLLHLTVRKESTPVPCHGVKYLGIPRSTSDYSAGSVSSYHLFSQTYGRFQVRMKSPYATVPGLQDDFWLWPDDRDPRIGGRVWPAAGEIDVAENYSVYPNLTIPFLHYTDAENPTGAPYPGVNTAWDCHAPRGQFNTYTLDWSPTTITITVNGTTCLVNHSANPAFQYNYILGLTAALGSTGNVPTAGTPFPATTEVDYIRVWQ